MLVAVCFVSGTRLKHIIGSSFYITPSVLKKDYGTEADLWSLGIVLYVLLCGCPPFVGKNDKEKFQKIMNNPLQFKHSRFNDVSKEAKHLISGLLTRNPEDKRMTASDVLGDVMWCLSVMPIFTPRESSWLVKRHSLTLHSLLLCADHPWIRKHTSESPRPWLWRINRPMNNYLDCGSSTTLGMDPNLLFPSQTDKSALTSRSLFSS